MRSEYTTYVHFVRDEQKDIIYFNHPLTTTERQLCYDSGYNDIALEGCVAMVPIHYTGNYTGAYFSSSLPHYIPIYPWEYGRSCYTIQRTINDLVVTMYLYSDLAWAKWTRDLANQLTSTLNHNQ